LSYGAIQTQSFKKKKIDLRAAKINVNPSGAKRNFKIFPKRASGESFNPLLPINNYSRYPLYLL
jgi:hypothetical protein